MPRSLANGDYSLVMAIESASRANSWYRVLADRRTGQYSCDCPAWTFRQNGAAVRSCKHTLLAEQMLSERRPGEPVARASGAAAVNNPLIRATQQQWPGLGGRWSIEERTFSFDNHAYYFVALRLTTGNGRNASGMVAFQRSYHLTPQSMIAGVAGWAGYTVAAEVARQAGFPLAGQPPEHFKLTRSTSTRQRRLGLGDILRVGDQVDLGDGYTPAQRAENTLRLFLGEELYTRLEQQHFLDVSSVLYAAEERVYRVRRDPAKLRDRRVRVFRHGNYENDFCIVRGQDVPEADHWLTVFLNLISDEQTALAVVAEYNVFPPRSDGYELETVSPSWQPRVA